MARSHVYSTYSLGSDSSINESSEKLDDQEKVVAAALAENELKPGGENMIEFKVVPLSSSCRLELSDFDTILMFLQNLKLSSGMLIQDYRITASRTLLVRYKSEEAKSEVLKTHKFYVSTGSKHFKLIANEPLNHSNATYAEIKNTLILTTKNELEFTRARVFCENLAANAIGQSSQQETANNELKSIRRSMFFKNAFILEFKNEIDFKSLVEWNNSFTFLNAYQSRTLLVKQCDKKGENVDQELIEYYFNRNADDKFSRIFVNEPFYLLEYENEATCEQILAKKKHHILNHELQIEYLYNIDMIKNITCKAKKSASVSAENTRSRLSSEMKNVIQNYVMFILITLMAIFFYSFLYGGNAISVLRHDAEEIVQLKQFQIELVRSSLSEIHSDPRYANMSIEINEPARNATLKGTRAQIDALKSSVKSLFSKNPSVHVQVNEFQMRFLVQKEHELRQFAHIVLEGGESFCIRNCRAFRYDFEESKIVVYGKRAAYCAQLIRDHVIAHVERDILFLREIKDHDSIAEFVRRVNAEVKGAMVEYTMSSSSRSASSHGKATGRLRFIGLSQQVKRAYRLYSATFDSYYG